MDKDAILGVLLGSVSHVVVGNLPHYVASFYSSNTVQVWLGKKGLLHIAERHPDITVDDLLLLPAAIQRGLLIRESDRQRGIAVCFQHPTVEEKRYIAALKFASGKRELWVSTFHRSKARQTMRKLKRGHVIRPHAL